MHQELPRMLKRYQNAIENEPSQGPNGDAFKTYAITNLRGGVGKSTLAFNLAWELSRRERTLLVDVCPQRNLTQTLMGEGAAESRASIHDALSSKFFPGNRVDYDDLAVNVSNYCTDFAGGKGAFLIPGSMELSMFPSILYTQIAMTNSLPERNRQASVKNILHHLADVLADVSKRLKCTKVIIDTSPFFAGATHLAWVAADALVIPVRADQLSVDAFRYTLSMLSDSEREFRRTNKMGGIDKVPKVHAVAITHCGWNRQKEKQPDRSTQAFFSRIAEIAEEHKELFTAPKPVNCIHYLDDFLSAGRISGSERIPIPKLHVGKFHTIHGQRLQVNPSVGRYQNELSTLAEVL